MLPPARPPRCGVALSLIGLSLACWAPLASQAQVLRCTDAQTGKTTYTDGTCPAGSQEREILPRPSPEEQAREAQRAALAHARERQQASINQARREREQQAAEQARAQRLQQAEQAHQQAQQQAEMRAQIEAEVQSQLQTQTQRQRYPYPPWQAPPPPRPWHPSHPAHGPQIRPPQHGQRPPPPPAASPPPAPHRCNVFRCYDKQGNSWPR